MFMQKSAFTPEEEQMIQREFEALLEDYAQTPHRQNVEIITHAFNFAHKAHYGVRRLSGEPYIMHPLAVARICVREIGLGSTSICSALLHDVVEDTDVTFDDLREKGIPETVIGPLRLLTRDKDEDYMSYIERIGTDPVAARVKLADLRHNLDKSRYCRPLDEYERKREEKYRKAEGYLRHCQSSNVDLTHGRNTN